jgi:lysophospholipase L1-like esterase
LVGCLFIAGVQAQPAKWEPEIRAFEAADKTNPPPAVGIVFVGSSSVRLWKTLAEDFKGFRTINRGFGGSQMDDSAFYADRIVLPYRPRQVMVYAGDNDIAAGKNPAEVLAAFKDFVQKVHRELPETEIDYISIKPSPSRWKWVKEIRETNRLIASWAKSQPRVQFIDVFEPMLGDNGQPREELFQPDRLHLNPRGYALLASLVRPFLIPEPR